MLSEIINKQICQKNKISYILFDKNFTLIDYNDTIKDVLDDLNSLRYGVDIREIIYDFIGMEEEILELKTKEKTLSFPMIRKKENFYDLEIETIQVEKKDIYYVAYYTQKSKKSLDYIEMIKKINKKTLHFETSDAKYTELLSNTLINFHVNQDGFITECNEAFCFYFNLKEQEVLNTHFANYFQTRENQLKENNATIFTTKNTNGKIVYFHANIIPLKRNGIVYENLIICQDISYIKEVNKQLKYVAELDTLTGIPNKSYFLKQLDKMIEKRESFLVSLIDLDNFSSINQEYGAHAGDMLLKHFADILHKTIRKEDIAVRLRGDSFALLLHLKDKDENVDATLQRIQKIAQDNPLVYTEEDTINFSFSLVTCRYPQDRDNSKALLKALEKKMFKSKNS